MEEHLNQLQSVILESLTRLLNAHEHFLWNRVLKPQKMTDYRPNSSSSSSSSSSAVAAVMAAGGGSGSKNNSSEQKNEDRKSTRLNSSHVRISYAVFCL